MRTRFLLLVITAAGLLTAAARRAESRDRRIVDTVVVGDAQSEAAHGYDHSDAITGLIDGTPFRQTRGWMHFSLTTFDDTDVTLAMTFARVAGRGPVLPAPYDLVVEGSLIDPPSDTAVVDGPRQTTVVEVAIPFRLTRGKTSVSVFVRARDGLTPPLHELRIIQDHYEVTLSPSPSGVVR